MTKYSTEQRVMYVFVAFAVLSLGLAVLPPIDSNSISGALVFASVFLFFGVIGTKFSYAKLEEGVFSVRFLLFSERNARVNDIRLIRYAPTWKIQRTAKSLYIYYDGMKWWPLELKNTMYPETTLVKIVRDLTSVNPSIESDHEVRALLRKYESAV